MIYGDGLVRGRVKFQNGEPPNDVCFSVVTGRRGECFSCQDVYRASVSASREYTLEGLPPGEYKLTLHANTCGAGNRPGIPPVTQTALVGNGVVTRADFVVDLNKRVQ